MIEANSPLSVARSRLRVDDVTGRGPPAPAVRRAVPRSIAGARPSFRPAAPRVSVVEEGCRMLVVALISGALLGALGWRFTEGSRACRPFDLRAAGMADTDRVAY